MAADVEKAGKQVSFLAVSGSFDAIILQICLQLDQEHLHSGKWSMALCCCQLQLCCDGQSRQRLCVQRAEGLLSPVHSRHCSAPGMVSEHSMAAAPCLSAISCCLLTGTSAFSVLLCKVHSSFVLCHLESY